MYLQAIATNNRSLMDHIAMLQHSVQSITEHNHQLKKIIKHLHARLSEVESPPQDNPLRCQNNTNPFA